MENEEQTLNSAVTVPLASSSSSSSLIQTESKIVPSPAVISFRDAVKRYGRKKTIGPVNLEVRRGDVLGFLGPNGSGKTTCIRMMLGLMRPSEGRVLVNGLDPISKHASSLRHVAYSPELPNIQTFLTPTELLSLILHEIHFSGSDKPNEIRRVLELVGLSEYSDTKVGKLSKGMVQRLSVAQALIGSPEILVLDEPMIGLDPAGASHFREIFREFSKKNKGTVFMSSHIMSEVESLCTSVAMIHHGRILFHGPIREVIEGALDYTVIEIESSLLAPSLVSRIAQLEGVSEVRQDQGEDGHALTEVVVKANYDSDLRSSISAIVVNSGAKLFTIKRANNLLERAYIEAIQEEGERKTVTAASETNAEHGLSDDEGGGPRPS